MIKVIYHSFFILQVVFLFFFCFFVDFYILTIVKVNAPPQNGSGAFSLTNSAGAFSLTKVS